MFIHIFFLRFKGKCKLKEGSEAKTHETPGDIALGGYMDVMTRFVLISIPTRRQEQSLSHVRPLTIFDENQDAANWDA